jgi:hypothetical protein
VYHHWYRRASLIRTEASGCSLRAYTAIVALQMVISVRARAMTSDTTLIDIVESTRAQDEADTAVIDVY